MRHALTLLAAVALASACSAETPATATVPPAAPDGPPGPRPNPSALFAHTNRTVPATREIGWAVLDLGHGGVAGQNPTLAYPQQSVFKLWLAAMVLDLVDRGQARLDERIVVTRDDLGFPHQPIAAKVDADGYPATLEELIRYIVIESDNPSADVLLRRVGGPSALTGWLQEKGIDGVRVDRNERTLHAEAEAMRVLTGSRQKLVIDSFVAGERDGATPGGTVDALAKLHRGELLSAASTRLLLSIMAETRTGPNRIKAGLEPGWRWAHKTGTGGEAAGRRLGANDVGLLTAPDGRVYAVAVYMAGSTLPLERQEAIMAEIARGVVAQWKQDRAKAAG